MPKSFDKTLREFPPLKLFPSPSPSFLRSSGSTSTSLPATSYRVASGWARKPAGRSHRAPGLRHYSRARKGLVAFACFGAAQKAPRSLLGSMHLVATRCARNPAATASTPLGTHHTHRSCVLAGEPPQPSPPLGFLGGDGIARGVPYG